MPRNRTALIPEKLWERIMQEVTLSPENGSGAVSKPRLSRIPNIKENRTPTDMRLWQDLDLAVDCHLFPLHCCCFFVPSLFAECCLPNRFQLTTARLILTVLEHISNETVKTLLQLIAMTLSRCDRQTKELLDFTD
jgi:hypothetical protein